MSVGETLRELGEFLDRCEESDDVTSVELGDDADPPAGDQLAAEIEVEFPVDSPERGLSLGEPTVTSEGGVRFVLESPTPVVPLAEHEVDIDVTDARIRPDGSVSATLSASVPVERETATPGECSPPASASDGSSDPRHGRDVPPFRDPELLEEVYSSCETFAEMTDAIGMDVTAETVRRYMIDHGIHEPDSYDTADETGMADSDAAGSGETEVDADAAEHDEPVDVAETDDGETATDAPPQHVVLTDGIGLPEDVTVETLIRTVRRSNTVLEVKRDLGIERQEALDLLQRLDMVDLVVGRIDAETERDISRADVVERLRSVSATA